MSKPSKPGKKSVELRPSRIRRDPPARVPEKKVRAYPTTERDAWIVVVGVVLFALAISALTIGISAITS